MNYPLLLIILLVNFLPVESQYTTTPTRTQTVDILCSSFTDRSDLVSEDGQSQNTLYKNFMKQAFTIDAHSLINTLLTDAASVIPIINQHMMELFWFVGAFVIGLAVTLLIWMFLVCCCCCPHCCPAKCCRSQVPYSKGELYWPTIVLMVGFLIVFVCGILGLVRGDEWDSGWKALSCSVGVVLDDAINGNVTDSGRFWIGASTLLDQLDVVSVHIDDLATEVGEVGSGVATAPTLALDAGSTALDLVDRIPNNTNGGAVGAFAYGQPIDTTPPTSIIASTMPNILGDINTESTLIHTAYSTISNINEQISSITTHADSFINSIPTFKTELTSNKAEIETFVSKLTQVDDGYRRLALKISEYMDTSTTVVVVFFALVVGLAIVGILSTVLMTFCEYVGCRYVVYFTCCLLFVIGIVGFVLACMFSLLLPVIYFGCQYIQVGLQSPQHFDDNFGVIFGQQASYLAECVGNGVLVDDIMGTSAETIISLSDVVKEMDGFDAETERKTVGNVWDTLTQTMDNLYSGHTLDVDDAATKDILERLAQPSNYVCTVNNFQSDSWIPTLTPDAEIACTSMIGNSANKTECPTSATIQAASGSCNGCMDSREVLAVSEQSSDVKTDLDVRYGGVGDCGLFATEMQNVWNNYYELKEDAYEGTGQIMTRISNTNSAVNNYETLVQGLGNTFTSTISDMNGLASSVTDPEYGLVAGLNCKLFADDVELVIDTFCVNFFNLVYFLRLVLGVASYGILLTMCCSVCSGVRHFKQFKKRKQVLPEEDRGSSEDSMGVIMEKTYRKKKRRR